MYVPTLNPHANAELEALKGVYEQLRPLTTIPTYVLRGAFRPGSEPVDRETAKEILRARDRLLQLIPAEQAPLFTQVREVTR
ncbi:hypothetical protein [Thioalkalivibrio sp.]|uniref:hypothetical protein n=1 Tax=Thioalkalivibrio sp. TaxID=2093813 RepID=UPI00356A566D